MPARRSPGFTLVEVIVALIILAAAAAMAGLFASTSMGRGAAATVSFNDELALRNALEEITTYYKAQIAADTLALSTMATYVNSHYPSLVDSAHTGYLTFSDADSDGTYTASSVSGTYSSGSVLLVTLTSGGQSLGSVFSP